VVRIRPLLDQLCEQPAVDVVAQIGPLLGSNPSTKQEEACTNCIPIQKRLCHQYHLSQTSDGERSVNTDARRVDVETSISVPS
jgi:hypothetical protein